MRYRVGSLRETEQIERDEKVREKNKDLEEENERYKEPKSEKYS